MEREPRPTFDMCIKIILEGRKNDFDLHSAILKVSFETFYAVREEYMATSASASDYDNINVFGVKVYASRFHSGPPVLVKESNFKPDPDFDMILQIVNERRGQTLAAYMEAKQEYYRQVREITN